MWVEQSQFHKDVRAYQEQQQEYQKLQQEQFQQIQAEQAQIRKEFTNYKKNFSTHMGKQRNNVNEDKPMFDGILRSWPVGEPSTRDKGKAPVDKDVVRDPGANSNNE
ncbi:hypothetical protein PIB30_049180 [Stylosanthes scabra]|uniref:Uncharacterized protein n=1 Tax=Stylosanthes scabra TaxID=79078 RepID=A0ABU6TH03_9FABA|nr:hypothetical protein [Stylosanthes scabra]